MNDKPTYLEYLFRRDGNVVKTKDGRYFWFDKDSRQRLRMDRIARIALVLFNFLFLSLSIYVMPNLIYDYCFVVIVLLYPMDRFRYLVAGFEELAPGSNNVREASAWKFSAVPRILIVTVLGLMMLFTLLNSFTVQAIKGVISGPRFTSIETDDLLQPVIGDGTQGVLPLPGDDDSYTVRVQSVNTPASIRVSLDGQPIDGYSFRAHSFIWEPSCLLQEYRVYFPAAQIRDGSTLTLTCGGLTREWVFETEDQAR